MRAPNCLLLLTLLLPLPALAADPAYITAAGVGSVSAPPDTVTINAGVINSARTAREALSQNSQSMNKVFAAMRTLNIAERNIRTTNLSLQPQYAPPPSGSFNPANERPIIGYQASNDVSVTLDDVTRAGPVLDALVAAGANQSGGISFSIRDTGKLLDQARTDAVKDAMARARIYAAAAGVALGPVHSISDTAAPPVMTYAAPRMFASAKAPTPIAAGEQTLQADVTMSWEIRP